MNSIATAISNGRTDTSFVDDLNALRGTVNSRVALLLRSIEVHPLQLRCVVLREHTPPHFHSLGRSHTRVFWRLPWERAFQNHKRTPMRKKTVRHESQMNETAEGCAPRWSRVFHATTAHHSRFLRLDRFFLPRSSLPPSRSFLPSLLAFPAHAGILESQSSRSARVVT